jgi:hypothetical protein
MQELASQQRWSHGFNEVDRETQMKKALDSLESENGQLKRLVIRLSKRSSKTLSPDGEASH